MVNGVFIAKVGRDDLFDGLFQDLLPQVLGGDVVRVLGRNDGGVGSEGNNGTTVAFVLDHHLGLSQGRAPDSKRHQFWGFGSGVSEHETLITSTEVLGRAPVETLSNVRRLLLNGDEDVVGLVVETLGRVAVPNVPDSFLDNLLVVYLSLGRDFTKDHDHSGLSNGLASNLGELVLLQVGIELYEACQRD